MLQLAVIRQDPEFVKERLGVRNFTETDLVDKIVKLDDQRKKLQLESDTTQSKINSISKEIGQLMAKGQKQEAEGKKQEVADLKSSLGPIAAQLTTVEEELNATLIRLPNLPAAAVPRLQKHRKALALKTVDPDAPHAVGIDRSGLRP